MKYDITKKSAPAMPNLGKGTECIKLLLSQTSKDMHEPLVPMLFPVLGAHISGAEFQYPDHSWKETCGMMANLVAETGGNKGQLSTLVEAICRDFREHDDGELNKLVETSLKGAAELAAKVGAAIATSGGSVAGDAAYTALRNAISKYISKGGDASKAKITCENGNCTISDGTVTETCTDFIYTGN